MTPMHPAKIAPVARRGGPRLGAPGRPPGPRVPDERSSLSAAVLFLVSNMSYFVAATLVAAHLLFAIEEHAFAVRLLTAIPGVILVLEGQKFLKDEAGELPFVVLALLQYYVVFCVGVFFELRFFDLRGIVIFTQEARLFGAAAVAIGAVGIWAGARVGRHAGRDLRPWAAKVMPTERVPEEWDRALYMYGTACMVAALVMLLSPNLVPPTIEQPILYALPVELALGFTLVVPPRKLGERGAQILLAFLIVFGMLRGALDSVFRGGIAYVTGRWATLRTISFRIVVIVLVLYAILQPVKGSYRQQVWAPAARTGQALGVTERVSAWQNALSVYFSDREFVAADSDTGGMARLSELGSVMHAFQMLPGRVESLDGKGFLPIVYAPIPRFIWPSKPTTREHVQRYGIVFGRQSEEGARTTAVNLPLLVEGYWNLGWPGIVLVTVALGFWLGLSQKVFAGDHWALRATGIANITNVTVASPIVYTYGTIFQTLAGRTAVCWGIFWLAMLLSRERPAARVQRQSHARAGLRRPGSRLRTDN